MKPPSSIIHFGASFWDVVFVVILKLLVHPFVVVGQEFKCFESGVELREAVEEYLDPSNDATLIPSLNVSLTYGYPIGTWCTDFVEDFSSVFIMQYLFNEPLDWNTSSATSMSGMFFEATMFNQPLTGFDTSNVQDMSSMFQNAESFRQDLTTFDTSKVTTMASMFERAYFFNNDISSFDTSNVVDLSYMFSNARSFNQPISNIAFVSAETTKAMFQNATSFNQPISPSIPASSVDMTTMFWDAESFNQNLCDWGTALENAALLDSQVTDMFLGTSCPNQCTPDLTESPPGPFCYCCRPDDSCVCDIPPITRPTNPDNDDLGSIGNDATEANTMLSDSPSEGANFTESPTLVSPTVPPTDVEGQGDDSSVGRSRTSLACIASTTSVVLLLVHVL